MLTPGERATYVFRIDDGIGELGWIAQSADPRTALRNAHIDELHVNSLLAPSG